MIASDFLCGCSFNAKTHRFVFDSGAGDTQVKLAILLNAGINQGLNRALILKQQECISWKYWAFGTMSAHQKIIFNLNGTKYQINFFDAPLGGK